MPAFRSISTSNTDAYRAGAEIGEGLRDFSPEVILLFASILFEGDFSDFFSGLYDGLGTTDVLVFGGTGDGIYETKMAAHYGVCALGISSQKKIRWHAALETGVTKDSQQAAQKCARAAMAQGKQKPSWAFVLADGVKADGVKIVQGIQSVLPFPFAGGLTGDDRKFTRSRVFLNGREYEDAVAVLLAEGELSFVMHAASGWSPLGQEGVIEESQGNVIYKISGKTPREFLREQINKPFAESDLGVTPLATYFGEEKEHFSLRTLYKLDETSGALTTFGGIDVGTPVQVCSATREQILEGVSTALGGAVTGIEQKKFTPGAVLIISCAGRKWLLENSGGAELEVIQRALGQKLPLVGFPSFGEMAPFRKTDGTYTQTRFHNVTFVLCLLGK